MSRPSALRATWPAKLLDLPLDQLDRTVVQHAGRTPLMPSDAEVVRVEASRFAAGVAHAES